MCNCSKMCNHTAATVHGVTVQLKFSFKNIETVYETEEIKLLMRNFYFCIEKVTFFNII